MQALLHRVQKQLSHLNILGALDWLGIFPQPLYEEVTGLVNALLDGNGVGSRGDCLSISKHGLRYCIDGHQIS